MQWWLHFLEADLTLKDDNEKTFVNDHLFRRGYFQHIEKKHTFNRFPCKTAGLTLLGGLDSLVSCKIKLLPAMPPSHKAKEKTDVKKLLLVNKN